MKKNFTRILALVLCLAMLLSGCGKAEKSESAAPEASAGETKDTVRIAINVEPTSTHPGMASAVVVSTIGMQMYDTLIVNEGGEYKPSLAKSWSWSEDNLHLTFELRDDVTFHNGEKMTAEDVAFSYNTVMNSGYSEALCGFMDTMEVIDDTHVVLHCSKVYGAALESIADAALGIFPKAHYEADPEGFDRNPCGTGPYKFVAWNTGANLQMEAFEDCWRGAPAIKNVEFVIYNNAATSAALALENGEIDVLTTVAATDESRLAANKKVQLATTPGASIAFIMFSMEDGSLFQDENLRLAVAHGINKEEVLIGAAEGKGVPANSIFPNYSYGIADYVAPGYDPEKAQEYLAAAGYPDGITIPVVACSADTYYKPAEIVQAQLAEVGINLEMEKMEQNAWFEDVWRAGNYGMSTLFFACTVPDVLYYYEMFTTNGSENFGHVNCPELDEAYDRARTITDPEERAQACYDVVKAFGDHAVCVPIYETDKTLAASAELNGFEPDPIGYVRAWEWSWAE